jgi:mono/diheme cytochrome c family protein
MNPQSICRCVIASILSITATSWAQTSLGLGRADYKDNCASCHGASGKGDGPVHSFLVKPASDLTTITQRHGGKFPQELMWEVIDGRWSGETGRRVVGTQPDCVLAQVPGDDPAAIKAGDMR